MCYTLLQYFEAVLFVRGAFPLADDSCDRRIRALSALAQDARVWNVKAVQIADGNVFAWLDARLAHFPLKKKVTFQSVA